MNYRSLNDLNATIRSSLSRIPLDFDIVVGIPRTGLLPASLVALYLNKPLADLHGFISGTTLDGGARFHERYTRAINLASVKALLVDDSIRTGAQIAKTRQLISDAGLSSRTRIFCVFSSPSSTGLVDHFGEVCDLPRVFEWNIMHNIHLRNACVDIDGVLCRDPFPEENDDGVRYERFLETVNPLVVPSIPIGRLVTCRLERYRRQTADWLDRHGIRYDQLIMMDHPTKAARTAAGNHGTFKAEIYLNNNATLFIESSLSQAQTISRMSAKPVYCTENRSMIPGS